jgi:hypothetical protein
MVKDLTGPVTNMYGTEQITDGALKRDAVAFVAVAVPARSSSEL